LKVEEIIAKNQSLLIQHRNSVAFNTAINSLVKLGIDTDEAVVTIISDLCEVIDRQQTEMVAIKLWSNNKRVQ